MALAPPLAITAYNTARWQNFLEDDAREEALSAARLVAFEFSQIVDGTKQLMLAMGRHPAVPDNEQECTRYFKSVIAVLPNYREAAVIDPEGKFHCSSIVIPPTLDVRDRLYFANPMKTGELTIGTLVRGRVTGESSIHISMPYAKEDGANRGVIVLILNPDRVAQDLSARPWRRNHKVMVLDREGSLVVSIPKGNEEDTKTFAKEVFPRIENATAGVLTAADAKGRPQIVGFTPLDDTPKGLYVAVSVDREMALAEVIRTTGRSFLFALFAIFLAIMGTLLATEYLIRQPILSIVRTANKREQGDTEARFPPLSRSTEFGQLSAALSRMSAKVDDLLEQKNFLMRELQHRVMNSLNLLSSVLDLQRRHVTDPAAREQLARARDRVLSIGSVYRQLYQADHAGNVEFSHFLRTICEESQLAYVGSEKPTIEVRTEPLVLSGSHAVALAVLTHELITNALKHAYAEGEPGPIFVSLTRADSGGYELRFIDRGRGLPADFEISESGSLGFKVIMGTARQLGGSVEVTRLEQGTEFLIRLPAEIAKTLN